MLRRLADRKIPIKEIKINPQKHQDITQSMVALLAKWPELKDFAQSGLTSYIKSVYLSPSKDVFCAYEEQDWYQYINDDNVTAFIDSYNA